LRYTSPNAPTLKDLLGTWVLASLSGAWRYAHVTALRGDRVNPQGLGMEKVVSEDSLRRAFQDQEGNTQRNRKPRRWGLSISRDGGANGGRRVCRGGHRERRDSV
jgi:hypothetical protein